ncbi:DNA methyltransferase [Pantoea ananatis]|uniref:DNA methyltransferase n=1 Tax=Pantoea ananas TaxID=553 RepID=UPI003F991D61
MIAFAEEQLNIIERTRTSILPWRGQFSPELVEYLIDTVCESSKVIYDPFCGSGTVLLESVLKKKSSVGSEVNPAAWYLSSLMSLTNINETEKNELLKLLSEIILGDSCHIDVLNKIKSKNCSANERVLLSCSILLGMKNSADFSRETISKGITYARKVLESLPLSSEKSICLIEDARKNSLEKASVDSVITSPPYINVFNYHQNYRPAIELLGWKPLDAAKSEIGANRKHRQNRFLTVVQYCLDMSQVIDELSRVTINNAPLIFVVGRESNVLGTAFKNSDMIKGILSARTDINLTQVEERKFINKYGQNIYEDIIIAKRNSSKSLKCDLEIARAIGLNAIENAIKQVKDDTNKILLEDVVKKAELIHPSNILNVSLPDYMKGDVLCR